MPGTPAYSGSRSSTPRCTSVILPTNRRSSCKRDDQPLNSTARASELLEPLAGLDGEHAHIGVRQREEREVTEVGAEVDDSRARLNAQEVVAQVNVPHPDFPKPGERLFTE